MMEANQRISADNVFEKDKRVSEQIRDIGTDYNAVTASASQQNRGAVDEPHINQSHVAGGISKVNTSDVWISILANPTQRAAGEGAFQFLTTRCSDGVGKRISLTRFKVPFASMKSGVSVTQLQQTRFNLFHQHFVTLAHRS